MATLYLYIILATFPLNSTHEEDYSAKDRYNDSLRIYNFYKSQIQTLLSLKESDKMTWYIRENFDDTATACARLRLQRFNKHPYEPDSMVNREGYGTAYHYPKPSDYLYTGVFIESGPKLHYVVYDYTTRFLTYPNGRTRLPYILKITYDKGRVILTEKLNPITKEKLVDE